MSRFLALIAAFVSLAAAVPVPVPGLAHAPAEPPVRVGTFNIRYANDSDGANAWRHRRETVLGILREGDIWGLQEALPEQVREIGHGLPDMKVFARSREADATRGEACPIVYRGARWELDASESGTFWLSETPETAGSKSWDSSLPRICTVARLVEREASKRALYVFNVHLDHQGPTARLQGLRVVLRRIADRRHPDPVVLLGDFNCGPESEPIAAVRAAAAPALIDAWRARHASAPEQGTFNGWAERCGDARIDWIWVGGALEVRGCEIDAEKRAGMWPSDHAFVRAELAWTGKPGG